MVVEFTGQCFCSVAFFSIFVFWPLLFVFAFNQSSFPHPILHHLLLLLVFNIWDVAGVFVVVVVVEIIFDKILSVFGLPTLK